MRRYTVQVDPPVINWSEPGKPEHWHWSVEARSETEAIAIVQNSNHCKGMPARIVPPLG
jgi:hypothetical protein